MNRTGSIVLLVVMLLAPAAEAHGVLRRSFPAANAVVSAVPGELVLEFNEAVDPRFSEVRLLGPKGVQVARGGEVSADGRRLRLVLHDLAVAGGEGAYVVRWRVLSAVDGHTSSGAYIFAVGTPAAGAPAGLAPGPVPSGPVSGPLGWPPLSLVLTRWLSYLGALLLAGAVIFEAVILPRAIRRMDPAAAVVSVGPMTAAVGPLRTAAAAATVAAVGAEFAAHAAQVVGGAVAQALRRDVLSSLLVQTRIGWSALLRVYAAALLLLGDAPAGRILRVCGLVWLAVFSGVVILLGGPAALGSSHLALIVLVGTVYGLGSVLAARIIPAIRDVQIPRWRGAAPVAAALVLAGFALISHAAGAHPLLALLDWLHLGAAAVWVGGLPALLLALRRIPPPARPPAARVLVPAASAWAAWSLAVVVATGAVASRTFAGTLAGLTGTPYGRTLLVKLALVGGLVVLGALNRFVLRPRIAAGGGAVLGPFRVTAGAEVALGAAIVLVVAALGVMVPAAATVGRPTEAGLVLAGFAAGERLRVRISPGAPGLNEVTLDGLPGDLRLRRLDTLREVTVGSGGTVDLAEGWWEIVARTGRGEATFPLVVGTLPSASEPEAVRLLARARTVMGRFRSWREIEQITDGTAGAVETVFEVVRPDRLRYQTSSGTEAVIVGAVRVSRDPGGDWIRDRLPQPIHSDGPYVSYLESAADVRLGGADRCGPEPCRVVFWALRSGPTWFAARIGASGRIYGLDMVAPAHYMTSTVDRLDAPISIVLPPAP